MGHYTLWLTIPALIGIPIQLFVFWTNDFSAPCVQIYSFCLSLWAIVMLEYWKRKESMTALSCGMTGYEDTERDRPGTRKYRTMHVLCVTTPYTIQHLLC